MPSIRLGSSSPESSLRTLKLAWRNVWRNSRRSMVTIAAMTFALWVMVLYMGLVDGMLLGMERDALELETGELQIVGEGYRDDPSIYTVVEGQEALLEGIDGLGFTAAPRLRSGGLAGVEEESAGVSLIGIDVARDAQVTVIATRMGQGAWLDAGDPGGVVIGKRLAKTLNAQVGDALLLLSQGTDGSMANDLYTIRGVLMGVGDAIDRGTVFMTEDAFRRLMVLPTGAHQITVRVPPGTDLDAARASLEALSPHSEVRTWKQLLPTLATMIDSTRGLIGVVAFIVYIAIAILILNAMLMAVFERIREFGVMKAIGFAPGTVFGLILLESSIQTAIATALGLTLAAPAAWYLQHTGIDTGALGGMTMAGMSMMQRWTGVYSVASVQRPVLILWFMVSFAVLWPALKAAGIQPVDAMRHR